MIYWYLKSDAFEFTGWDHEGKATKFGLEKLLAKSNAEKLWKFGIAVRKTTEYREMAEFVDRDTDLVLEIGSANGVCSKILLEKVGAPNRFLGLDISASALQECREKMPEGRFESVNIVWEVKRLLTFVNQLIGDSGLENPRLAIFFDIGGIRELETVVAVVPFLQQQFEQYLRFIVVKSCKLCTQAPKVSFNWDALCKIGFEAIGDRDPLGIRWNPLNAPVRRAATGEEICRFLNLRECKMTVDECKGSHDYCYTCLEPGHSSQTCKLPLNLLVDFHTKMSMIQQQQP